MKQINIQVINAFSVDGKGGNPAGVVFGADNLTTEMKQAIATAAGFPETAFVSSSAVADYKLDFFTPLKQIPHCGHATIATFSYLKKIGEIAANKSSKETIDGCRSILFQDGIAYMEQSAPVFHTPNNGMAEIIDSLGIAEEDLAAAMLPSIVNTGNSFLIIPVADEGILADIEYKKEAVYRISEQYGLIGYYVYATPVGSSFDATTRMFAPFYGIAEEAGTGMAAGPLAAYLFREKKLENQQVMIEQGKFMQPSSPSLIQVNLEVVNGLIQRLFAGGDAYVSGEKVIELED